MVRDVIEELDPDGAGYRTKEAGDLLFHRLLDGCTGTLSAEAAQALRMGAVEAIKNNGVRRIVRNAPKAVRAALESAASEQSDMSEIAPKDFPWIHEHTALGEGPDAVRKIIGKLDLPETRQVIALMRKKSVQTAAKADRIQKVVDRQSALGEVPAPAPGEHDTIDG